MAIDRVAAASVPGTSNTNAGAAISDAQFARIKTAFERNRAGEGQSAPFNHAVNDTALAETLATGGNYADYVRRVTPGVF